jgi:hypothetical protein
MGKIDSRSIYCGSEGLLTPDNLTRTYTFDKYLAKTINVCMRVTVFEYYTCPGTAAIYKYLEMISVSSTDTLRIK